jgi:hypothetical protein
MCRLTGLGEEASCLAFSITALPRTGDAGQRLVRHIHRRHYSRKALIIADNYDGSTAQVSQEDHRLGFPFQAQVVL